MCPRSRSATVINDELTFWLDDGRTISTPLAWYPRLMHATEPERQDFQIIGRGEGLRWPNIDEDLSVAGMLAGQPSGEAAESLAKWLSSRSARWEGPFEPFV